MVLLRSLAIGFGTVFGSIGIIGMLVLITAFIHDLLDRVIKNEDVTSVLSIMIFLSLFVSTTVYLSLIFGE